MGNMRKSNVAKVQREPTPSLDVYAEADDSRDWYPRAFAAFREGCFDADTARMLTLSELEHRQWLDKNERLRQQQRTMLIHRSRQ